MSTPSSPPASPAYVPYQAYKSKRHSRNLSVPSAHLTPEQAPSVPNGVDSTKLHLQPSALHPENGANTNSNIAQSDMLDSSRRSLWLRHLDRQNDSSGAEPSGSRLNDPTGSIQSSTRSGGLVESAASVLNDPQSGHDPYPSPTLVPSLSHLSPVHSTSRKVTTFRRLPRRKSATQSPVQAHAPSTPSSPLAIPLSGSNLAAVESSPELSRHESSKKASPVIPIIELNPAPISRAMSQEPTLQWSTSRLSTSTSLDGDAIISERSSAASLSSSSFRQVAPYRPGFQPRGLYRSLTDEFLAIRKLKRDGDSASGLKRIERTKLERRLEKLISLHFPHPILSNVPKEGLKSEGRPNLSTTGADKRRASSFFDFQSLRHINLNQPSEIWKGVITGGLDSSKADIRAAEQRITPWQDDATVSKCPLCSAVFHPLTNRKHHCRLCGQIICSLPVKHPQRPAPCSVLFVVDSRTRQIEEVDEGVDYGVRKRKLDSRSALQKDQEEEKFLKGVRVCRECRPVLLRQKYLQQARDVPLILKLYEDLINLEADIEEFLPKFQELVLTLSHNDQPTKEASAARKRLLDSFAQYDKLAKKIRALPSPHGVGSSHDRIQAAILTRANLFLQKNMFPLQSLPTPRLTTRPPVSPEDTSVTPEIPIDVGSSIAHRLQPLLEQENLLESFVAEATNQRKFEDVKTLKGNLAEIRQEIERLLRGNNR